MNRRAERIEHQQSRTFELRLRSLPLNDQLVHSVFTLYTQSTGDIDRSLKSPLSMVDSVSQAINENRTFTPPVMVPEY